MPIGRGRDGLTIDDAARRHQQPWLATPGEDLAGRLIDQTPAPVAEQAVLANIDLFESLTADRFDRVAPEFKYSHRASMGHLRVALPVLWPDQAGVMMRVSSVRVPMLGSTVASAP